MRSEICRQVRCDDELTHSAVDICAGRKYLEIWPQRSLNVTHRELMRLEHMANSGWRSIWY